LDDEFDRIWRAILASPNSYVMTDLEYKIFNYLSARVPHQRIAQKARHRYWTSRGRVDGTS
jgi:hypothetical protein